MVVIQQDDGTAKPRLVTRVRGADGRFGQLQEISRNAGALPPVEIRFNGAGATLLGWTIAGDATAAEKVFRPAGGLFSVPFGWLTPETCIRSVTVAFLPNGNATAACSKGTTGLGSDTEIVAMNGLSADGTSFDDAQVVQGAVTRRTVVAGSPRLEVAPDGRRALAWITSRTSDTPPFTTRTLWIAMAPPDQPFGAPRDIASATDSLGFADLTLGDLAILADGRVVTVYTSSNTPGFNLSSYSVSGSDGSNAGGGSVSNSSGSSSGAQVERDGSGALVVWREDSFTSGNNGLRVATIAPGSTTLSSKATLPGALNGSITNLEVTAGGAAVIAATVTAGSNRDLVGWTRTAAGRPFSSPVRFATAPLSSLFDSSIDRHGSLIAVWSEGTSSIQLGGIDVRGPALSSLSVPGRLRAGRGGTFSVSAVDPAGVKGIRWDFGDRSAANGGRAGHTYRRAGRYRVTLVATDQAGQQTRATRTVTVVR